MIAIIDYGVGNLYSLSHSLTHIGAENIVTRDPAVIERADKLILPGVGAFGDAKKKLDDTGLTPLILRRVKEGAPFWASAWACRCCLTGALNTASTRDCI